LTRGETPLCENRIRKKEKCSTVKDNFLARREILSKRSGPKHFPYKGSKSFQAGKGERTNDGDRLRSQKIGGRLHHLARGPLRKKADFENSTIKANKGSYPSAGKGRRRNNTINFCYTNRGTYHRR